MRFRIGVLPKGDPNLILILFGMVALIFVSVPFTDVSGFRQPAHAEQRETRRRFRPIRVVPAQPALKHPPVIAANRVRGQVTDSELILGLVIDGEARGYPINMLTGPRREIINDTLGGQPIAATW